MIPTAKLQALTVKDLRALAAEHGIPNAAKLLKAELIAALSGERNGTDDTDKHRTSRKASFTAPEAPAPSSSTVASTSHPAPAPQCAQPCDPGLPIPDHYGVDRLVLMVQDPHHIFAYWELTGDTLTRAQQAGGGTPVLVIHGEQGDESREIDLHGGNYYLAVAPKTAYEAELALRDRSGKLTVLARSNRVSTPSPTISTRAGEQWMGIDDSFHELLELAGLPERIGQGAGSVARLSLKEQRTVAWGWTETVPPGVPGLPSSHTLTNAGLGLPSSHTLSSTALVRK
jgi:hypothetical protein